MRIGIVAGEASGDLLGSGLITELRRLRPELTFEGIAGPRMIAAGAVSLYPMERLSVMGLAEVLGRYAELHKMRKELIRHFCNDRIDLFIGVDAPDFNLGVAAQLHKAGIKTVQYVSPQVWAWRQYRVKKIARSIDLMLTLLPFEAGFYQKHQVPVRFVGHPLADLIPMENDKTAARHLLKLPQGKKILAILPGSRSNEVQYLGGRFLQIASWCYRQRNDLHFITPLPNPERRRQFEQCIAQHPEQLPITLVDGMSREVVSAADVVLLASGTAALETMLLKRPMVVAYRMAPLTYWISKKLVKLKHFSLPNLLLPEPLVPEFLQEGVTPELVGKVLLEYLNDEIKVRFLTQQFNEVHMQLKRNASVTAAAAVLELLDKGN
ncbi:MAG: lipid-A-disaccharide synthase [Gammaproteobacteria bacterium]|nr:lipid-A-disaccharide synthase [Gammaproteobacteria bacterium]